MAAPLDALEVDLAAASGEAVGWDAFTDLELIGDVALVLAIAVALAAAIAYHPLIRRKAATLEEIEEPKTLILYSMVGAVVAAIVKVQPNMALVVFGIGGLLRFRTNAGNTKNTGRVILVTVVGLCCGLELYVIAALATVFGWLLIFVLERTTVERVIVQGIDVAQLGPAAAAHAKVLADAGCEILGEQKNAKKGLVALVFRAPAEVSREVLRSKFAEVEPPLRGAVDFESG